MTAHRCLSRAVFGPAASTAGLKASGALDLAVLAADGPCAAAGTFTTNRVCAAPVKWCRERLPADDIRAVVINSGNANAATGEQGFANARRTAELAAAWLGCRPEQVLVASTGIIGHQLPMDRIEAGHRTGNRRACGQAPNAFQTAAACHHDDRHPPQDRLAAPDHRRQDDHAAGASPRGPR